MDLYSPLQFANDLMNPLLVWIETDSGVVFLGDSDGDRIVCGSL